MNARQSGGSFFVLWVAMGLFGCTGKDHTIISNNNIVISSDVLGRWEVVEYIDSGIAKTESLMEVSIQFNSDGAFFVFREDSLWEGNWDLMSVGGLDHLWIEIIPEQKFYELFDDDWLVVTKTTSTLELVNTSVVRKKLLNLQRI